MMDSMSRFGRGLGRHPMPIPHSEDSETDEYNVIDSDRQYERIGDRGSSTGTSSTHSSNHGAIVDQLIGQGGHLHNPHLFHHHKPNGGTLGKPHPLTTHYAESAIYRRSRGLPPGGSPNEIEPPLIPESQLFMSGANGQSSINSLIDGAWKSQHSTLEFGHLNQGIHHQQQPSLQSQNTTVLSTLDSTTNTSQATTTTSVHASGPPVPVYESACLMRTASGSLYIPSGQYYTLSPLFIH